VQAQCIYRVDDKIRPSSGHFTRIKILSGRR
jgi:hypothetical protein